MPKNGQVSEQFAFFLYAMLKHTSCSNYETFGLDQVVGQWSAQFLVPLSKNHSLSGSHPLSWWTTWQRSKRFTVSKSQLMFSFRKMFMEGCVVLSVHHTTDCKFSDSYLPSHLCDRFGITTSQICMVGDRLDTDILFGQNGGCKTLLVLSGFINSSVLTLIDDLLI